MRTIKIINGVYGHKPAGSSYIEPKQAGDPPFEVDDDKAENLVAIKIAVYADLEEKPVIKEVATPPEGSEQTGAGVNMPSDESGSNSVEIVHEKPEYNIDMKATELREIMDNCQLIYKVGMSKADMVAALDAYFEDEGADEPPKLGAEDPIV